MVKENGPPSNLRCKRKTSFDEPIKTGDLFWIIDDGPGGYYLRASVLSLRYGNDGDARSAEDHRAPTLLAGHIINSIPVFESSLLGLEDIANANARN